MTGQAHTVGENSAAPATGGNSAASPPPPDLRLRTERPRVVRLSRTVVWSLGGVGMIAVAFALGYAFRQAIGCHPRLPRRTRMCVPLPTGWRDCRPTMSARMCRSWDQRCPVIWAYHPHAQEQGKAASGGDDRRAAQEIEAAIASKLFVQTGERDRGTDQATPPTSGASASQANPSSSTDAQSGNRAFLAGQPDRATTSRIASCRQLRLISFRRALSSRGR